MIIRPINPLPPLSKQAISAWEAVLSTQTREYEGCWMITQPSHAALAGELAAAVCVPQFPTPDAQVLQAISLHDAGWGIPDAQTIMKSRSVHPHRPQSFVAAGPQQFVEAWTKSIDTCEAISPVGGYVVSRHFWRLAQDRSNSIEKANPQDRGPQRAPLLHTAGVEGKPLLDSFLKSEVRREKDLAGSQSLDVQQLELLTDLLQFCDLLSLYISCGASESVFFPAYFGLQVRASIHGESYTLDPPVLRGGTHLAIAALRYPATKEESSRQMKIRIE